jgi:hypothetical protein
VSFDAPTREGHLDFRGHHIWFQVAGEDRTPTGKQEAVRGRKDTEVLACKNVPSN